MYDTQPTASSFSNFQFLFDNALKAYEKRTKSNLFAHPLAARLQACKSPTVVLALLHQQAQELNQSQDSDERLSKWLDPTVNVLYAFSGALGEGAGLVFSPARTIFAGIGVLLQAARDVRASRDTLIDIFERIETFFRRLEIYLDVPPTTEMTDIIVQILVVVLCILGIATKEIKESQTKKYVNKLFGRTDLEDELKRLDKLTHEEARLATAKVLKVAHTIDDRVRGVAENVVGIDNRVTIVDDRVAGVDNKLASVDDRVKAVEEKVAVVIHDGNETKQFVQQTVIHVDQLKRNQLRESIHKWLSPPDPSTNHNIARGTHHKGSANWFLEGSMFREWKETGSLLWIQGKPGSGKSVLCSTIVQDIGTMCKAGQASMAYFDFDFRNIKKQHLHDLIPSLLIQLSAHSDSRCNILSDLYAAHDDGKTQPNDIVLTNFLKEMFTLPDQLPTYLVMDALDECPDISGIPSPRERVVQLVKELVELRLPNLHICVTSRPEIDIRDVLEPLTSLRVSLHDQSGQKQDIVGYVKSIVYSDSERVMKRWKMEDKDLVIETLSKRADGMFRWVFCQLEALRHCLPSSVRRTLAELPESLDETYERVLKEIKKPNRDQAHCIMQCLVVAVRPLGVKELAEVLAVDFDDSSEIAKLKPSWRWEDEEHALLSSCSSLITISGSGYSRVVQFSHFSVKEYLTSARFGTSSQDVSRYHIALEPAHTILAQACLGILLQSGDVVKDSVQKRSPLKLYASDHWITHAQFENVTSHLGKAMEYLFDLDKPHFMDCRRGFLDIDRPPKISSVISAFHPGEGSRAGPLYYAALCGFHDLADHLIHKYPQQLNSRGGYHVRPLVAALAGEHYGVAEVLLGAGAAVDVRGFQKRTPLHSAMYSGHVEAVEFLLKHNADVHSRDPFGWTPFHFLGQGISLAQDPKIPRRLVDIARLLLEHGADINARATDGSTPLHLLARWGMVMAARVLLEHGANTDERDNQGKIAFQIALEKKKDEIVKLLLAHGAKSSS